MIYRIISLVQHFPALIIIATLLFAGAAGWYGSDVSKSLQGGGFAAAESESTKVKQEIEEQFGDAQASLIVVMSATNGQKVTDVALRNEIEYQANEMKRREGVASVETYLSTGSQALISKDKTKTVMLVSLKGDEPRQALHATKIREETSSNLMSFGYAGPAGLNSEITEQVSQDLVRAETISFTILAVLLVVVFRGFVAALLPLILGGLTIISAFAALKLIASFTPVVEYALNVIILLGLGLAVDYALLIVSRFREELYNYGNDTSQALAKTYATAGRTVLFSGLTVIISLASLIIFPLDFLRSMGIGGVAAVSIALITALIVLPAILRLLGPRVNWLSFGSVRRLGQAARTGAKLEAKQSFWYKTGAAFMKRPVITLLISLGFLAIATLPVFHISLASPDENVLPRSSEGRELTQQLMDDFDIRGQSVAILYHAPSFDAAQLDALRGYIAKLEKIAGTQKVESVFSAPSTLSDEQYEHFVLHPEQAPAPLRDFIRSHLRDNVALIHVEHDYSVSSAEAQRLVTNIRALTTPSATAQVGGFTAEFIDQLDILGTYLPYSIAIIMITLFVLLFLMLGSVVIPLKAMLQNLLSLGAAFGGLVLIFGDGALASFLHLNNTGVIYATLPAIIFAIAFGLSMDYSVFLYSRIKEQYDKTGDNEQSVLLGLQKTGGIITSAAILLLIVVLAFATSGIAVMQQIGVGLALAITLDAFVVRMVLVPSTMKLLGEYNWWAPKRLRTLQERLGWGEKD